MSDERPVMETIPEMMDERARDTELLDGVDDLLAEAPLRTTFKCSRCGHEADGYWLGGCPGCGWLCDVLSPKKRARGRKRVSMVAALKTKPVRKVPTDIAAFDEVTGGGIVTIDAGCMVLITGTRGQGKTTLLMQVCQGVARRGLKALYASGEMNTSELLVYAQRLGITEERVEPMGLDLDGDDVDEVMERAEEQEASLVILDSVHTAYMAGVKSAVGSREQVKESINVLSEWVKRKKVCLIVVCHVGKDGEMAGPEVIQHLCDVILDFREYDTEGDEFDIAHDKQDRPLPESKHFRMISCEGKNRFGDSQGRAVMKMTETGLIPIRKRKPRIVQMFGRNEDED